MFRIYPEFTKWYNYDNKILFTKEVNINEKFTEKVLQQIADSIYSEIASNIDESERDKNMALTVSMISLDIVKKFFLKIQEESE